MYGYAVAVRKTVSTHNVSRLLHCCCDVLPMYKVFALRARVRILSLSRSTMGVALLRLTIFEMTGLFFLDPRRISGNPAVPTVGVPIDSQMRDEIN